MPLEATMLEPIAPVFQGKPCDPYAAQELIGGLYGVREADLLAWACDLYANMAAPTWAAAYDEILAVLARQSTGADAATIDLTVTAVRFDAWARISETWPTMYADGYTPNLGHVSGLVVEPTAYNGQ
jgi:alkylhydroperoxidase family enzyme